ncbi:hypothetical protein D9M73_118610 [compost metagenome]
MIMVVIMPLVVMIVSFMAIDGSSSSHLNRFWVEACLPHDCQRKRVGFIRRVNPERTGAQLEAQGTDSRNRLQCLTDFRLFGTAVHGGDAENLPARARRRRDGI